MTGKEFASAMKETAEHYRTAYMLGTWGWPATESNIGRALSSYAGNARFEKAARETGGSGFMFDCCGLVKGILWGWQGDATKVYGGAGYAVNGVPDVNEDGLLNCCTDVSGSFDGIAEGEYLWMLGHCGVYIGDGLAVEATPAFSGGVVITAVGNIGSKSGYPTRTWEKHGKLKFIEYDEEASGVTKIKVELQEISKGSSGEQVRSLQQLLIAKGYSCGKAADDGVFGDDTHNAVVSFQKYNTACGPVDGIAGVKTWKTILG